MRAAIPTPDPPPVTVTLFPEFSFMNSSASACARGRTVSEPFREIPCASAAVVSAAVASVAGVPSEEVSDQEKSFHYFHSSTSNSKKHESNHQ